MKSEQHKAQIEELVKRVFTPLKLGTRLEHPRVPGDQITFRWQKTLKRMLPLGGASTGNKLTIFSDGDTAFESMWASIKQAKERVWMETYILEPDTIGRKTLSELIGAAHRGVEVKIIYDFVGSKKLLRNESFNQMLRELRSLGGEVVAFNPLINWPWKIKLWGFFRNHRKVLVIDDAVGYCGGMNCGDEYSGKMTGGTGYFRDTHVKVTGPAVKELSKVFLNSMAETGKEEPHKTSITRITQNKPRTPPPPPEEEGVFIQVLMSNMIRNRHHIQKSIRLTLRNAQDNCYMTTPYFLPPIPLKRAILAAAKKGVDVRILTAGMSDAPIVRLASQHIYHLFLNKGVKIYELTSSALHSKTITVDGIYSTIGSFNLDPWSHFYNLELNLAVLDPQTALQLEADFKRDLTNSVEVTTEYLQNRTFFQRCIHWAAYNMLAIFKWKSF